GVLSGGADLHGGPTQWAFGVAMIGLDRRSMTPRPGVAGMRAQGDIDQRDVPRPARSLLEMLPVAALAAPLLGQRDQVGLILAVESELEHLPVALMEPST